MLPGKPPPSGERWLRGGGGCCQENLHRHPIVATRCQAVDVARKISTVWRTVATGCGGDGGTGNGWFSGIDIKVAMNAN